MYAIITHRAEPLAPHNSSKPTSTTDPFWLPGRPLISDVTLKLGGSVLYGQPSEASAGVTEHRCHTPKRGLVSAYSFGPTADPRNFTSNRYLRRIHDSILDDFAACQMRMVVRSWAVKIRISELVFCTSPAISENAWAVIVQSDLQGENAQEYLVYRGGRTDLMMAVNNSIHFRGFNRRLKATGSGWNPVLGETLAFELFKEPEGIEVPIPHLSCSTTGNYNGQPIWHSVIVRELPQSSRRTGSGVSAYLSHLNPKRSGQLHTTNHQPAQRAGAV
jgi:hypothetical protein